MPHLVFRAVKPVCGNDPLEFTLFESTCCDDLLVYPVRPEQLPGPLEPCLGGSGTVGKVSQTFTSWPVSPTEPLHPGLFDDLEPCLSGCGTVGKVPLKIQPRWKKPTLPGR
jgi:hypothetical protein